MTYTNPGWTRSAAPLVAILAISGCTETTGPDAADEALLLDMALVAADATIEDMNLWSQPLAFGALPAPGEQGGQFAPGRPGGRGGFSGMFSGTHTATFYDEDGNAQASYDALTTASMHIEHEIQGDVERDGWSATIYRERDKWATGLAGEETHRTWNGTGSEEVSRSRHLEDGTERSYESSGTMVYEDVVVPIPGSDPRWPVSGTITRSMTAVRSGPDGEQTRSVVIVITFDGTATAMALVNGEVMEIDLSARDGRNPLRPRGG